MQVTRQRRRDPGVLGLRGRAGTRARIVAAGAAALAVLGGGIAYGNTTDWWPVPDLGDVTFRRT